MCFPCPSKDGHVMCFASPISHSTAMARSRCEFFSLPARLFDPLLLLPTR
jgi:hypothetical protein